MATGNLRPLHRDGANFVFRHRRLLVGWHVWENQQTEAWLGEITSSQAAGEVEMGYNKDWYRTYASSDGQDQMRNDIMDVNKVHPAMSEPHHKGSGEDFLNKGRLARIEYLVARYQKVISGRYMYSMYEGEELRYVLIAKLRILPKVAPKVEDRKRKRKHSSSEDPECGGSSGKKLRECSDDDDEEEIPFKLESMGMDAIDQTPTVTKTTTSDPQQRPIKSVRQRPLQSQSHEQIATATANLDVNKMVGPGDNKPADQTNARPDIRGAAKADPMALTDLANALRDNLIGHVRKWANYASTLELQLKVPAGELVVATDTGKILVWSRSILQRVNSFYKHVEKVRQVEQQTLEDIRASGMSMGTLHMHETLIENYRAKETELKAVIEEVTWQIDELQNGLM
jgi:hypothetical protein